MLSLLPRHSDWGTALLIPPSPISLPRNGGQVGLCNVFFEDCSAFTRVTACTLAGSSKMTRYIKGSSHFVTSMTAPIASGWSKIAGWDLHPLRNAALTRRTPEQDLPGDPGKVSDTAEQVHHILPGTHLKTGIATGKKMRRPRFRVTAPAAFERINPIGGLAPPRLFQQANHG